MTGDLRDGAIRRIYYWVHHTGRYDGNTGVQRVVRALGIALDDMPGVELVPVCWCAEREAIVRAGSAWTAGLACYGGPLLAQTAEADVPLHLASGDKQQLKGAWLLLGEVPHVEGGALDAPGPMLPVALDYARYYGLRIAALFYDLIPLRVPGYETMAASHAAYAAALAAADLILPISRTAAADLSAWWREQGRDPNRLPALHPVMLAAEMVGVARATKTDTPVQEAEGNPAGDQRASTRFLAVGTVEPRKNQLALMQAVNRLRQRRPELDIRLDVVGRLHEAVAAAVEQQAAQSDGRIRLHRFLPDAELHILMQACDVTVFVSHAEGFGLPVAESLWHGKPCLCSDIGSMAEIALGGGCLSVDPHEAGAIERGVERLAEDASLRAELADTARSRPLSRWVDYARAILAAFDAVSPVPLLAVIEGRRGGGEAVATALEAASARVWRHHWREDSQAILPCFRIGGVSGGIGRGDLRGLWALLPLASTTGPAEGMRIQDEARGLGLKLAIAMDAGQPVGDPELMLLAHADLVLFATEAERDLALDRALRSLPRTATLRHRFRVAGDASAILGEIAAEQPRIAAAGAPRMPGRIFYWTGLTAIQPFNTGVQRVTRALGRVFSEFGIEVVPVKWDEARSRMSPLDASEAAHLEQWNGPPARPPAPLPERLAGEWLVLPEITIPVLPHGSNVARHGRALGMRTAAIFYDLIPLKMSGLYPAMLPAFSEYWPLFAELDLALPISWTVAADLRRYLSERGLRVPPLAVCPLAGDLPGAARQRTPREGDPAAPLRLVAIGTWEPRKNYVMVLRALMRARRLVPDRPIHLTIVGRRAEFLDLNAEIEGLALQAGDVDLPEHVSDTELLVLVDRSDATIFASWEEGFGLPVLESLWRGLPCLCHDGSAMAEVAPGGGTIAVNMLDEAAAAQAIARLAAEEGLLDRLRREAVERPIRDWDEYARDVLSALARAGAAPGWPLPAILKHAPRPLLSCAVTTYNRARWLTHTLPRLIEAARPYGDRVEVVVCDNTSTDNTPELVARFAGMPGFSSRRNRANVGMLGNLGATVRASNGAYVWLIGDDDLIVDGAIGSVLDGLEAHPDVEMAYLNYGYTNFDAPEQLANADDIVLTAHALGHGGANRRVDALREVAALNENLFTAIYACAFRRDHALRAYQQDVSGPPFSSLLTCIPSSVYALAALQDRPAWWVGKPALVVNMNVSWLRWVLLWHLERMPDLFDAAELAGIDPVRVDRHRAKHCWNAGEWVRMALNDPEDAIRSGVSVARLLERSKHVEIFKEQLPGVLDAYTDAWQAGRIVADPLPPAALFARYGLP